ncbi:hypothetical protein [Leisingera aquaemixtae]|uniref:hypothetical protein n=1 Tax=Leisingera aquaemixtae TaxID=1396826 RepID=UPI0021A8052A|nr:hypothetical protein [Leisingera aquaemixtae]
MHRRTLLFAISSSTSDTTITAAAEAAREQRAHLACLLLRTLPGMPHFALWRLCLRRDGGAG